MRRALTFALAVAVAACFSAAGDAQQTTPKEKGHEHPKEHPEQPKSEKRVSTNDIDKAIREHIAKTAAASGGKFPVQDDVLKKNWDLELVKVHNDKLQALADGRYFACVDFKAGDGTMVDVDFFMKKEGDALVVTDTTVHKINGKARYSYQEKDGVWVRVADKA